MLGGREADYPQAAAAVDVSANRVALELRGDDAVDVLAQGCSLDLHPSVFEPGSCAQTLLARAQVILVRPDSGTVPVLVRPSFAPYLRAWLEDAVAGWVTPARCATPVERSSQTRRKGHLAALYSGARLDANGVGGGFPGKRAAKRRPPLSGGACGLVRTAGEHGAP